MRIVLACALVAAITTTTATTARAADDVLTIRAELEREVAAWNRGDLDDYLRGYERAPSTTMVGSKDLVRGWDAIAARYRNHYGDKAHMGQLSFSDLDVRVLGGGFALALGHFALARDSAGGGPAEGWFTLTLRKTPGGWRIVIDHTS